MILVVGATGRLGGLIAQGLLHKGTAVRILVRPGSAPDHLVAAGAQTVSADLKDPQSLRSACAGVEAVVTTANSMGRSGSDTVESVDRLGNRNLVDAAAAAGVGRFVFTSVLGASTESPSPFIRAKGETEERLRGSGMEWTVLRPDAFMDTWIPLVAGGPVLAGQPLTIVGQGQRRHSFVAMQDVATYAVAALSHPDARDETLTIGGPDALSWRDVANVFEQELARPVVVRTVAAGQPVPGVPPLVADLLAVLDTYDSVIDSSAAATTYGVTPTPVAAFVRRFLADARSPVS